MVIKMSGREFRELRKRLKLRQDEIAKTMGVTRQTVSVIENREDVPSLYALALKHVETLKTHAA